MPYTTPTELPRIDDQRSRPEPPDGLHPHRPWWTALLVLLIVAAGGGATWWFAGQTRQQAAAAPPMKVPVMTAVAQTVPIYRSFPATTQAIRSVTIQARVTGYLLQQGAADGADVAAGTLLYKIDPNDYQAAFDQAKALLAQANASLRYSRVSQGRNQILAHDGWVSQDTSDQANSTFNQGQASLASNDAALKEAALNLGRTDIYAPFAGRIGASQVFTGSLISVAGATLNTLVQLDPIYVSFNPAESNLEAITRQQAQGPVAATVSQSDGKPGHTGTLTFVDNQVSLSTGTILLRATVANPDHGLLPGQYVTATLHLGDLQGALLVPQNAVGSTQIGQTLMIVGGGDKVEQRIVTLGDTYDESVVVTTGLKAGDQVITGQLQKLRPGMPVNPAQDGPKP